MDRTIALPRVDPNSPPDLPPPEMPKVLLRNVAPTPARKPMPRKLKSAPRPAPKTRPCFGYTPPIQATKLYKATEFAFRG